MKRLLLLCCFALGRTMMSLAATQTQTVNGITWTYQVSNGEAQIYNEKAYHASPLSSVSGAITIPSTLGGYPVTSIGDFAFALCTKLTSVTIPSSVTSIGVYAFSGCSNLWKDENGVQYESEAKVVLIDVPASMTGGFVIPNSVRFIHSNAFRYCSNLTSVTIPSSVTSIGDYAFCDCSNLTSVTIPSSVTSIGDYAFCDCSSLTSVMIPPSVTTIGIYAFYSCSSLTSVTIPSSVTSIGERAFEGCSNLTSVTIPEGVTTIGYLAFFDCSALVSVEFKGKPPSMDDTPFDNVSAMGYYLPKYASEWEDVIGTDGKWQGLTMICKVSKFPVEVAVNGEGSVTGAGSYAPGESVTLTVTPAEGFVFCGWSDSSAKSATYTFKMPERAVSLTAYFASEVAVNAYVKTNDLMSKDEAKQELLDDDEVFTVDEMKALALGAPVIQVKNGKAIVSIQVQQASELDGEWEVVEDGEVSVEITPKAGEKAGFYKFVVPNEQ